MNEIIFVAVSLLVVVGLVEMFVSIQEKVKSNTVYRLTYGIDSRFIIEKKIGDIVYMQNLKNGARLDVSVDYFNRYFVEV
jgi:hypothetical protein